MGDSKIGTTGRGIGPAYEDKIARRAIRLQDLFYPDRFAAKLAPLLEFHNFVLTQYFKRDPVPFGKTLDETLGLAAAIGTDGRRRRGAAAGSARPRPVAAVRGRAGRAARHRSRHLSLRHVVELPRGRRGAGRRRRSAISRLRARHRQGLHDARGHGPVPDGADRRHRRAPRRARQRIRLGDRPAAPLRLARHSRARPLAAVERRRRPLHHQARRARRHARDPHLHRLHGARPAARAAAVRRRRRRRVRAGLRVDARLERQHGRRAGRSTRCRRNARAYLERIEAAHRRADRDGLDRARIATRRSCCATRFNRTATTSTLEGRIEWRACT